MSLDTYDAAILSVLQKNNAITQKELAKQVHLSVSAVNRRVHAMEESGVIKNHVTVIDPQKVGVPITLIVEIQIENERLDLLEEDKKRFTDCPNVQQVYYVTGEFDFLLVLAVRDMAEYESLTKELFFASKNIRRFRTAVSMQNIKQTFEVPLQ